MKPLGYNNRDILINNYRLKVCKKGIYDTSQFGWKSKYWQNDFV